MQRFAKNPRYLAFRGKPILSVGSGEHYGALLNADFDFKTYFRTLATAGLNQCRVFSGTYRELPGEFGIVENVLAPRPAAYLAPWQRVGERWDLTRWDETYWKRLTALIQAASKAGVLVELVLFCHWYNDALWRASPLHPKNNVQGVGLPDRGAFYSAEPNPLWPYLEAFVRKITEALQPFDNVYFELINEPYIENHFPRTEAFQRRVAALLHALDPQRLVALNLANRTAVASSLPENVQIINFHYAIPEAALLNVAAGRVLADDETGFAGQSEAPYRKEAWRFLLSGGGMFSHLDYSFTVAHPNGTAPITGKTPGFGGSALRAQLGFLRRTLEALAPWDLEPQSSPKPLLASSERGMAVGYCADGGVLSLAFPAGAYILKQLDPVAGIVRAQEQRAHAGGTLSVETGAAETVVVVQRH